MAYGAEDGSGEDTYVLTDSRGAIVVIGSVGTLHCDISMPDGKHLWSGPIEVKKDHEIIHIDLFKAVNDHKGRR